jgi:hypothetical protein
MPPALTSQLLGESDPPPTGQLFQFLQVNGFVYRCNTATGDMWRLEAHVTDKKAQVWKLVQELTDTAH